MTQIVYRILTKYYLSYYYVMRVVRIPKWNHGINALNKSLYCCVATEHEHDYDDNK